ncbi:hypothetical protein LGT41_0006030 [Abyssibius alkaniclasticus]|uniref:hypothetical protein n=1 Tax=Abyssibius alkaniclasticus TaxID=2881234 RepID=UPI0023635FE6|nr:hypothetical protein [Abyssibius alkaniclasticus]UPH72372.1 hypothetical protein LGT41_0006030 [Abyssibius alkaniclasticus]
MAYRLSAKNLTLAILVGTTPLAGCAVSFGNTNASDVSTAPEGATASEVELRERAAAMQRTVVEAIAAGGLAGAALNFVVGNRTRGTNLGFAGAFTTGAVLGGAAGSYVAYLQDQYATREDQLERVRADLRANNAETEATLSVMRVVLANQTEELNRLRAAVAASSGESAALAREVSEARANLNEMQRALEGAQARRTELSQSRSLIAGAQPDPASDAEIAALSERITQMRAVADALATQL